MIGLAAMLLPTGCADNEQLADPSQESNAIVLDVKEVATPVTRAQHTGVMDFTQLKATDFGVYGYKGAYNSESSTPTLFEGGANTRVTFEPGGTDPTTLVAHPGSWDYTNNTTVNLKEWESSEKYTFFAYAPYMPTAELSTTNPGIVDLSVKTDVTPGDPSVSYIVADDPKKSVDLLWGVRTDNETNSGKPWVDVQRGQTASAVQFTFYHALCAIGYHAQVIVDQDNNLSDLADHSNIGTIGSKDGCKLTLKRITLAPTDGTTKFARFGYLDLNNTTAHQPLWSVPSPPPAPLEAINILVLNSTDDIDNRLADPQPGDFDANPPTNDGVMTDAAYDDEVPGVTESANMQTVIAKDGSGNEQFFMLIPQDPQDYTVTVEYFITYKTASGHHREARTGTATISALQLAAGVKYYINLVFGLTTFKVNVTAQDWEESTTAVTIATETGTSASNSLVRRNDNHNDSENDNEQQIIEVTK